MLQADNLTVRYGLLPAVRNVSFTLSKGSLTALVGSNGAGKSTLLQALAGALPISAGTLRLNTADISKTGAAERNRLGIVLVPEGRRIFPELSVYENILMGAYLRRDGGVKADAAVWMNRLPWLKERKNQPAGSLSGGEQQMLAMARGLMAKPRLLLLDEPVMGLSPKMAAEIFSLIREINEQGVTVLLSGTEVGAGLTICRYGLGMASGELVAFGTLKDVLRHPELKSSYTGV